VNEHSITVTTLSGDQGFWDISRNLGNFSRTINHRSDDRKSISLLINDPELHSSLVSMLWAEVADLTSIARKDGNFGVLFQRTFECACSINDSLMPMASRKRVVRRVLADINAELASMPKLPEGIEFAIADPGVIENRRVALWAFVPLSVMDDTAWDYDLLEDVIALLTQ
jgi:hypothetical protein